jgi:nucleotide-binding universal stress UspA family protein
MSLNQPTPAGQLVDYARNNRVDHIVIGSRKSSTLRRYLGSVSTRVVAEAPCTVTVVRLHAKQQQDDTSANAKPN